MGEQKMKLSPISVLCVALAAATKMVACSSTEEPADLDASIVDSSFSDGSAEGSISTDGGTGVSDGSARPVSGPVTPPPAGEIRFLATTKGGSLWAMTLLNPTASIFERRFGVYERVGTAWVERVPPQVAFSDAGIGERSLIAGMTGVRDSNDIYIYGTKVPAGAKDGAAALPILTKWNGSVWTDLTPMGPQNAVIGGFAETTSNRFIVGGQDRSGFPLLGHMNPPNAYEAFSLPDAGPGGFIGLNGLANGEFAGVHSRPSQPNNGLVTSADAGTKVKFGPYSLSLDGGVSTEVFVRGAAPSTVVNLIVFSDGAVRRTGAVIRAGGGGSTVTVGGKDVTNVVPLRDGFLLVNSSNEVFTSPIGAGTLGISTLTPVPAAAVPSSFVASGTESDLWIGGAT
ncbi:MAG: hypothetical protein KBF88_13360 [Polyangiaceae bacterium]|nr:hypothetical protein [Polyangiaceae bacterium]